MFRNPQESHEHSLQTLNALYEYDDFMLSINTLVDLGCGSGLDLEWWATRTTRDDQPVPLNIQCTGIDLVESVPAIRGHNNIRYRRGDFESADTFTKKQKYDVLWCYNAFQYCINPIATLSMWNSYATDGAMMVLILPETQSIDKRKLNFYQPDGCYYHHSLVSLIHHLSIAGWDCKNGFFSKRLGDPWLQVIVYKSTHAPMDPKTTRWYDLVERDLLPESAEESVRAHGFLKQQDLILPWIDKSFTAMANQ